MRASSWRSIHPTELWARRHLAWMLFTRGVKSRYKQSMFGMLWAVVNPLVTIVTFSFLFGTVAHMPTGGIPYPVYTYAALLAWNLFAGVVRDCSNSVTTNRVMVERIYCPRLILPLSTVLLSLFDFAISFVLFGVVMLIFGYTPSANIIFLPLLLLLVILAGLSVGLWLAAASVWLHDIKFVVSYVIQLLLLLTPVGYGAASIPARFSFIVKYNPMATLCEAFRWCLLGTPMPVVASATISSFVLILLLIGSLVFFNEMERSFADVI